MSIRDAVLDQLLAAGIDTVFGIPGTQTLPLNKGIQNRQDIRYVMARHETAVTHQAWGYTETTGQIAATLVVPGPGDMNAMNGLKNALNDCTPLLHISIETEPEVRGGEGIHETPPDTYDNVVKENITVETPESTPVAVKRAIAKSLTPPKGPVRVGIPKSFFDKDVSAAESSSFTHTYLTDVPELALDDAAKKLDSATQPSILAGGGIRSANASDELQAIAERLDAPVVTTYKGKGVLPEDHELSAGVLCGGSPPELIDTLADSDVLLAIGTDFDAVATQKWTVEMGEMLIHITLNEDDVGNGYNPAIGIVADAKDALDYLISTTSPGEREGTDRAQTARNGVWDRIPELLDIEEAPFTAARTLKTVRESIPNETIVTVDAGGFRLWTLVMFKAMGPHRYVNPGSWATMGTGVPSAIGAQTGNPDTPVVALTGDGGLMMCLHELHTAVAEELPIVVVLLNNNDYAVISDDAESNYGFEKGTYAWREAPIDFNAIAEGVGMDASKIGSIDELEQSIRDALENNQPTLLEVPIVSTDPQAYTLVD
ncbi:thiamine pyrophosphate-binding protein [Halobellus marinus]|uniref:thiamine pyrophosphate-binding protein n=1 Tax=Halobellus TaxID=1073986 RepID=UPI0028A5DE97|nr:thiamine pyrophosphate-binding protein [Halobellus sp. DFY28]